MNRLAPDKGCAEICLIVDQDEVGEVADAKEAALFFTDDAGRYGSGHLERVGDAEAPVYVIADHLELGGGAAAQGRNTTGIHGACAGDDETAFFEDDFQTALDVFARGATGRRAGVADDGNIVCSFGGEDQPDHFNRKMEAIGNDFAGERGMGEECAHAHHFSAEPTVGTRFAQWPIDGVVGMDKMAGAVRSGATDLQHCGAGVTDGGDAAAFVKKLAEFCAAFPLGRVGENADEATGNIPEFFVFAADGIAQTFEFVRAAFIGMKVWSFYMDAAEVGMKFTGGVLVAEGLERRRHLLVGFGHDSGKQRGDTVLEMKTKGDVVAFSIRSHEIMSFAAVVVDIDQARGKNPILAINGASVCGNVDRRFVDPDSGNPIALDEEGAFGNEVRESKSSVSEESGIGLVRHGRS